MKRRIITISEELCNGCGACVIGCHEGAIGLVNGKAKLLRDDYCDGLGDCLPTCPTGAIAFEEREALAYDHVAVIANMAENMSCSCPGGHLKTIQGQETKKDTVWTMENQLMQWPVQIKLVQTTAPYFENAKLCIAADCTAYAYANFHSDFMKEHITIIGCPKLDMIDYAHKLLEILKNNTIKEVTVVRMEVPCCKGIEVAVKDALKQCGKILPWKLVVLTTEGEVKS